MLQNPYLKLFRISNVFTIPPDIIVGFLAVSINFGSSVGYSIFDLVILIFSSVFLYLGGLVLNDLFDIKVDRLERPTRPLPSGRIKKTNALLITVIMFSLGLILAAFVNPTALGISMLLMFGIVAYNYRIKNGFFRPYLMAGIRSLNVIYGASFVFDISMSNTLENGDSLIPNTGFSSYLLLALASCAVYFHIFILTSLSKSETTQEFLKIKNTLNIQKIQITYLIFLLISLSLAIILSPHKLDFLIFIFFFLCLINLLFNRASKMDNNKGEEVIKFLVKNMLILLIILDSAFIAGEAGFFSGIVVALLAIPCIVLGKWVSMT
ncbi:UbiA family prenyltransferase [Candidatus Nitrosocosmicus arcticus]|uniref:Putative UbiA prenyltransferase n=1 Tax=Candidatus Nitrosocosmicus arcticus TaxID=2035267 RepID=A0A557SYK0_9ARCH|nr:UbiA family prenyltransferase [Candidatus Nitrosocosmicus arcticus]TVP41678.1 putative UbiA prenyltransferase [Candidatus Nitrosocosmicus arcticus]